MNVLHHKYFLINYIGLIPDITNIIRHSIAWFVVSFKLPELSEFSHSHTYVNKLGVSFGNVIGIPPHRHKNKACIILYSDNHETIMGKKIVYLIFFYDKDLYNYYKMYIKGDIYLYNYQSSYSLVDNKTMIVDPLFVTL